MTFDPTKNDKPCCLMDPADLETLKNCGGPWQALGDDGWFDHLEPGWTAYLTYRQKPAPFEVWVRLVDGELTSSVILNNGSDTQKKNLPARGYILMREVE